MTGSQRSHGLPVVAQVRAMATSEPAHLFKLASANALFALVSRGLGCNDREALDVVKKRMALMCRREEPCAVEAMGLGAGVRMCDRDGQQAVRQAQKEFKAEESTMLNFAFELAQKRESLEKRAKRKKGEAKLSVPGSTNEQEQSRKLCPPSSYVWRNLRDGGSASHFAPYRRVSVLWAFMGSSARCCMCCASFGFQYLQDRGLPHSACSVAGLLGAGNAQPAQSASGDASSSGAQDLGCGLSGHLWF